MEEYAREPCPYRIVDDCGGAFAMGCIGGGVFQAIKGFRNAPSGLSRRFVSNFVHCDAITAMNFKHRLINCAMNVLRLAV